MNWGKGIALTIFVFILGMAFLVYKTTEVESEMVTDNYYEKELHHEEVIQAKKNMLLLSRKPEISIQDGTLQVIFPKEFDVTTAIGEIVLYRPSDPKKDKKYTIAIDENNVQKIPTNELSVGIYQVQLSWQQNQIDYYFEKDIYIN